MLFAIFLAIGIVACVVVPIEWLGRRRHKVLLGRFARVDHAQERIHETSEATRRAADAATAEVRRWNEEIGRLGRKLKESHPSIPDEGEGRR